MSTTTQQAHPLAQWIIVLYRIAASQICQWRAAMRMKRSLRQLERLDDFLLDDIGLVRQNNQIVPIKTAPLNRSRLYGAQEAQFRTRARSHKRERHRLLRRRVS